MKKLVFFFFLLAIVKLNFAQSLYQVKYNFDLLPGGTTYHAFLLLNEDGSGILRLRYQQNNQDILLEADATEQPIDLPGNLIDSTQTFFSFSSPRFIIGRPLLKPDLPVFHFTADANGYMVPSSVLPANFSNRENDKAPVFTAELIEVVNLRKNVLLQYYSEDEDFFQAIFRPQTRGLSAAEKNTRIHLLIVANTNDKTIGATCAMDKDRAIQTYTDLAKYLGIKLITDTVSGNNYSKKNTEAALKKLKPSPNDIVIFYYSGHGFRKATQNPKFPLIDLRAKPAEDYVKQSMSMEDIYKTIKKKGARVNLVLSDCCNNEVTQTPVVAPKPLKTKSSGIQWKEDNIRKLFLGKTPLSILATAADAGQKATGNPAFGGFFSYYFKTSMENYCSPLKDNPTWEQVLQVAKTQTIQKAQRTYCDKPYIPENICRQSPIYTIETGR